MNNVTFEAVPVLIDVFEKMTFMFGTQVDGEALPEAKTGMLEAFLEFSGPLAGSATIWASPELLDQISENLCDFDDDTARDTIGEIINVFVGQMLTTLGDEMIVFDLGIPVVRECAGAPWLEKTEEGCDVAHLLIEESDVMVRVCIRR